MTKINAVIINLFIALTIFSNSLAAERSNAVTSKITSACLYYASGNKIYKLSFPEKVSSLLYAIPQQAMPKKMSQIKLRLDKMVWVPGDKSFFSFGIDNASKINMLYTFYSKNLNEIKLEKFFTATSSGAADSNTKEISLGFSDVYLNYYLISPDSTKIAWDVNGLIRAVYDENGGVSFTLHNVNVSSLNGKNKKTVLKEQISSSGFNADYAESRKLLHWSIVNPEQIFMTTYFESQLYSGTKDLYVLNIKNSDVTKIINGEMEFLGFSNNERMIAWTPNDETCCGGSNYTSNSVELTNISTKKSIQIYDEWKEFGNDHSGSDRVNAEKEYFPIEAIFSPSDDMIAISIGGDSQFTTIRKVNSGNEIVKIDSSRVLGWIDEEHLLLGREYVYDQEHDPVVSKILVYDINSGREEILEPENIVVIGMDNYR